MKKISVHGGPVVTLCDVSTVVRGAVWGQDGSIISSLDNRHLFRIPQQGGKPQMLAAKPEDYKELAWRWPQFLPGGRRLLFTGNPGAGGYEEASLEVMDLETGRVKTVHRGGYFGRYVPSGHLIYVHQGTLFALAFDGRQETKGVPVPVLEDLAGSPGHGAGRFDFSTGGTLVYLDAKSGSLQSNIVWMDSTGKQEHLFTSNGVAVTPRLSPDGQRLAVSIDQDIWVYDAKRDSSTRITFTAAQNRNPVWMPDGQHIIFGQGTDYGIWWIRADGSGQPQKLLAAPQIAMPSSVSPNGRLLAFYQGDPVTNLDLWTLPLDMSDPDRPKTGIPQLFLGEPRAQTYPAFSPDGKWIAYSSMETGTMKVFVRPFPGGPSAGKWQISPGSGRFPVWSPGGRELFFLSEDHIMVAHYRVTGNNFLPEKAKPWGSKPIKLVGGNVKPFDVAADGKRLLVFPAEETLGNNTTVHGTLVLNFFDELRRRVPVQ
jgi:serine/threonine-protein kinase